MVPGSVGVVVLLPFVPVFWLFEVDVLEELFFLVELELDELEEVELSLGVGVGVADGCAAVSVGVSGVTSEAISALAVVTMPALYEAARTPAPIRPTISLLGVLTRQTPLRESET